MLKSGSMFRRVMWAGVVGAMLAAGDAAWGQSEISLSAGCMLKNDVFTCDQGKFEQVLASAKTAAIETGRTDAFAQDQLKKLIAATGKTLVGREEHPDMTFLLVPADTSGVQYTTNRMVLGSLRVFALNPQKTGRGDMVWVDNFTGEPDTRWSLVVSRLVGQFRARFHLKG